MVQLSYQYKRLREKVFEEVEIDREQLKEMKWPDLMTYIHESRRMEPEEVDCVVE